MILLINYGFIDYAFDIYNENEELQKLNPEFGKFFQKKGKQTNLLSLIVTAALDRILFNYLNVRKTNKLKHDSDRSYPIR
jgi:hypothetical protein